ncbi:MAG: hypothetical protein RIT45_1733 [Pseudomonadota bacterium]
MNGPARIGLLDPLVANQIAAGEVVERPSSAVKELVENALDAGATRVAVELDDGGKTRIEVADNGSGIIAEDAVLAFARHATSKIHDADELARVLSYGFRGEALASIAAVARVALETRPHDAELGARVEVEGSANPSHRPIRCAAGTRVIVRDLFFNVPARAAFLRAAATELGHVIRLLEHVALARPGLHLLLHHNGRKVLDLPARDSLQARAADVFGAEVAERLYPVSAPEPYAIDGLLSGPGMTRGSGSGLLLVVDGRPVRDRALAHSVLTAYGDALERGRHPVGVLHLRAPAGTVDVNVHPAKAEVRFASSRAVHAAVGHAVSGLLERAPWFGGETVGATASSPAPTPSMLPLAPTPRAAPRTSNPSAAAAPRAAPGSARPSGEFRRGAGTPTADPGLPARQAPLAAVPSAPVARASGGPRPIGQLGHGPLVVDHDGHFLLLDPHATHAFVLRAQLRREPPSSERLLLPRLVALEPGAVRDRLARADAFARLGFVFEAAGTRAVLVRAYPSVVPLGRIEAAVAAMTGADDIAALACCAAVAEDEAVGGGLLRFLLDALADVDPGFEALLRFAPHGRPAAVRMSHAALFDRIGWG